MKKKKISLGGFIKENCCNWIADKCIARTWNITENGEIKHYTNRVEKTDVCQVTALEDPCKHFRKCLLPVALKNNWWRIVDKYYRIDKEANPVKKNKEVKKKYRKYKKNISEERRQKLSRLAKERFSKKKGTLQC
ncbi:hypothetical protein ACFL6F_01035 [Planctomycetota bacterium]